MTFQPVLPLGGYAGWRFLDRTLQAQQTTFSKSPPVTRETTYFRENIAKVQTAQDLVNDRRLLSVALGAFGLDDDINNRFFIQKILQDGTVDQSALANRLADNRYAEFSRTFGFGDRPVPRTTLSGFGDQIVARYENRQFERAVGQQNNDLRLSLNLRSTLPDILDRNRSDNAQWFTMMGNAPLRRVFETALGLPKSIASIDIDQQRDIFKSRARSVFGSDRFADFADPAQQERLVRLFLVRAEAAQATLGSGAVAALTLLQNAPRIGRGL